MKSLRFSDVELSSGSSVCTALVRQVKGPRFKSQLEQIFFEHIVV